MTGSAVASALRIPDYELLQLVGRGSYGEVWMAHNALGSLRAVKVVWRKNFEDERPYEREFRGIRKFEPVSRKHEGLIDLYHVGRNNEEGYFYYAMELADDAAPLVDGEVEYRPRTLREELRIRNRLTIEKTMEIGIKLAAALDHLHCSGLVHRDIKPSNIIFVDGAPKLADIGLVAGISDARSYVGTEGYVPPEGPGTPAADIYSLGKVLYESCTGLDRNDFPKVPPLGEASGIDPGEFSEFNEVLLKACDPSFQLRYKTAEELVTDLLWIRDGKSLCRLRGLQRRKAFLWKTVTVAAAVAAAAGTLLLTASLSRRELKPIVITKETKPAEPSEMQKVEALFQKDDSDGALAALASFVRANPTNRPAVERLVSALTWRNYLVPALTPLPLEHRPRITMFTPDGEEIASALSDGTLRFWNAQTAERTWQEKVTEDAVTGLDWSPDRTRVLVSGQNSVRIYDAMSRGLITQGLNHDSPIVSVQFSPENSWILTGSSGTAQVWDAHDGQAIDKAFIHDGPIRRALFSPDGRHVATAGLSDGAVRLWDFATTQPTSPLLRQGRAISALAFSRSGRLLATASDDGMVQIWRVPDGSLTLRLGHQGAVNDVAFSRDGGKLAAALENGTAVLWDLGTHKNVGSAMRHRSAVRRVHFTPDGLKLVTVVDDRAARIWDVTTAEALSEPIRHPHALESVAFSPGGERMVTATSSATDSSLWLWKMTSREALKRLFPVSGQKRSAQMAPQTGQLCLASGQSLRIWPSLDAPAEPVTLDVGVPVDFFSLATDGTRCAVVSANNVWVWDLSTRQALKGPLWHATDILAVEFSPDQRQLAVATAGGHLMLWNLDASAAEPTDPGLDGTQGPDPREFQQLLPLGKGAEPIRDDGAFSVHFSPDGRLLLAACRIGKARVFDARTGELLWELPHKHWVLSAKFSADGRRIVTASNDRYAQVWDTATGRPVGLPMHHDNDVLTACFSPDGRRVLTASRDWTARIWDAQTGRAIATLQHSGPVLAAGFGPDGVRVATGSADETARIWDSESGQALTDPFRYGGPVQQVEFTADGSGLLVVPAAGDVQLIEVLRVQVPAPAWLPPLAEAVARQRVNERQIVEPVSAERFFRLKQELGSMPESGVNLRWAKWFLADPAQRNISPDSAISLTSYLEGLMRTDTRTALRQVIRLEPTHALAHARLAQLLISQDRRDIAEAQWHARYARKLQPESKEIARMCESVNSRIIALSSE